MGREPSGDNSRRPNPDTGPNARSLEWPRSRDTSWVLPVASSGSGARLWWPSPFLARPFPNGFTQHDRHALVPEERAAIHLGAWSKHK